MKRKRHLKKNAVPPVFENTAAHMSRKLDPSTKATSKNSLEEERKQLVTLEPSFTVDHGVSHSSLSEIPDEVVNETVTAKGFQTTNLRGKLPIY